MHIEAVECQKIVNRVISILGKNINIMNSQGIIIASGDKTRIGTFHEAARIAASTKREIIVDRENNFRGCRNGINLPIYNKNDVIGVIGITGEPAEVKGYGVIVKELVEMMIQEGERKRTEFYQEQALKSIAIELIKDQNTNNLDALRWRTQLVGFELQVARVVMVVDICDFSSIVKRYDKDTEIRIQEYKQKIIEAIFSVSSKTNDFVFNLYEDRFIIFKSLDIDIDEYCNKLYHQLYTSLGLRFYMGIGNVCSDIPDYYKSFTLANSILGIGRRLNTKDYIYKWDDYKLEILLQAIPNENKRQYLKSFGLFVKADNDDEKEVINTVKAYFENGMSIKNTAEAMFIHRNTVLYRLNKVKEHFGIDVLNNYNCMLVYIGILLKELD